MVPRAQTVKNERLVHLAQYLLNICVGAVIQLSWGTRNMLLAPLAGAVLAVSIAIGPAVEPPGSDAQMTSQQKNAAVQPLVRSATDCIARGVMADPRFGNAARAELGDLIVDSIPACIRPVRAMIDGYDRYFGEGTGQAFFMGPYLDVLPSAVTKWTADAAQ
jgi:hypothetical protein